MFFFKGQKCGPADTGAGGALPQKKGDKKGDQHQADKDGQHDDIHPPILTRWALNVKHILLF